MRYLGTAFVLAALALPIGAQDGLTLFHPFESTTTSLVDGSGATVQSWPGEASPALTGYLLPDGDLVRGLSRAQGGPGIGGGFERRSYDGALEWQLAFFSPTLGPHHDFEVLPNGNVLLIVWERMPGAAAIALGRDPATADSIFMPDAIYEFAQTGLYGGDVVWEWHSVDHVIQDFDSNLPGFGVVADHPELIDINQGPGNDWLHFNGIDYNPELDQIAVSTPAFHEVWVIDHSTTSAEAATPAGGNSGMGGDLLYRWGNPETYGRGGPAERVFYGVHDVQWIEAGRPGEGNLIAFNNGAGRPSGDWSSIDEWTPPVDGAGNYSIDPVLPFEPAGLAWTYSDPGSFYSNIMGGCERLANGNTLICASTSGTIFEVDPAGLTTWTHVPTPVGMGWIFKARRYDDCNANTVFDGQEVATGAASDQDIDGVPDECQDPLSYCVAAPNSTGQPASMGWSGSTSLSANDLELLASNCPPNATGLFILGSTQAALPMGDGLLCLAQPAYRLPITTVDAAGTAAFALDNQNLPAGLPSPTPGATVNASFWFRDPAGGPAGFNFSDGLSVTFSD